MNKGSDKEKAELKDEVLKKQYVGKVDESEIDTNKTNTSSDPSDPSSSRQEFGSKVGMQKPLDDSKSEKQAS